MNQSPTTVLVKKEEWLRLQKTAREKKFLIQLMNTSAALSGEQSMAEMLAQITKGIQAVGFDRVRIYFVSENGLDYEGVAHAGMAPSFIGFTYPIIGDHRLVSNNTQPEIFKRTGNKPLPYDKELDRENVQEWVYLPLMFQTDLIGLLVADNKFSQQHIPREILGPLTVFASQITAVINFIRLRHQEETARRTAAQLRAAYTASNALVSAAEPNAIWDEMGKDLLRVANADGSRVLLIDPQTQTVAYLFETSAKKKIDIYMKVRQDGLSMQIMKTGRAEIVEDSKKEQARVPTFVSRQINAALGLPLSVRGRPIGVAWVYFTQPRHFSKTEIEALQLYVNQAAIAYSNARRLRQSEMMRQLAELLAAAESKTAVLHQIVTSAQQLFAADSANVWLYDAERNQFVGGAAAGIDETEKQLFQQEELKPTGTALSVMEAGWLGTQSITTLKSKAIRNALTRMGIYSFQAVALRANNIVLGLLYVNYNRPRSFNEGDRELAEMFAYNATLALSNARLLEQVQKAHQISREVSRASALAPLKETLEAVAQGMQEVLECDVVTLHIYDPEQKQWIFPPTMVGVAHAEKMPPHIEISQTVVAEILEIEPDFMAIDDVRQHPILKKSRFTRDESILATAIAKLRVDQTVVGVIFASYRVNHHFTSQERSYIEHFANQTAVAIKNVSLYSSEQRQKSMFEALYKSGQALAKSVDLRDETINQIITQVGKMVIDKDDYISYVSVWLVTGLKTLTALATHPPDVLHNIHRKLGQSLNWSEGKNGRIGVIGRVMETKQSVLVNDVHQHPDYLPVYPNSQSELAVPMIVGDEVIGIINLEHIRLNAFDENDVTMVKALADQAAIALRNVRAYEDTKILQSFSIELSGTLQKKDVIRLVMVAAMKITNSSFSNLLFWDADAQKYTSFYVDSLTSPLTKYETSARTVWGNTQAILHSQKSMIVADAMECEGLNPKVHTYGWRSFVGVPLIRNGEAFAVLYVNSTEPRRFMDHQIALLETLAGQAVVSIDKAQQYEELKEVQGIVGSRTALAWMGMASNAWRHSIEGDAVNIKNVVTMLESEVETAVSDPQHTRSIHEWLDTIKQLASNILARPITPPLSSEEGLESIVVNELIRERLNQLWENESYQHVAGPFLDLNCSEHIKLFISPEWFRLALDLIIKNAVDAMQGKPVQRLTIKTALVDDKIHIAIQDTGKGMTPEIVDTLWNGQERVRREGNLGRGLLIVQAIVQTYGGDVSVANTSPEGTTMLLSIPILDR